MEKIRAFWGEVIEQLRQITWPQRGTLVELTVVVILVTAVLATVLVGADFVFTKLIALLTLR